MVVADWFAEVEDDGFGDGAVCGLVVGSVDVFGVGGGMCGGAHVCDEVEERREVGMKERK